MYLLLLCFGNTFGIFCSPRLLCNSGCWYAANIEIIIQRDLILPGNIPTVSIRNLDMLGFWIVKKRLVCKWSGFQVRSEIWKPHLELNEIAAIFYDVTTVLFCTETKWKKQTLTTDWFARKNLRQRSNIYNVYFTSNLEVHFHSAPSWPAHNYKHRVLYT